MLPWRPEGEGDDVVGDVTHKLVNGPHPFDLKNPEDLSLFSSVFDATVNTTLY